MTAIEFASWLPVQSKEYAADKVRSGNWPAAGATERAEREKAELLPEGHLTPGHRFFTVETRDGAQAVGTLWIKYDLSEQKRDAFIYYIGIDKIHQGKGYGGSALTALHLLLKSEGVDRLLLHVFGFNVNAQRLYARLGFEITNINMAKRL